VYRVKVVVSDGTLTDEEEIEITVSEVNEAPVLAAIGSKTVNELTALAFTASATDADLPANALAYSLAGTVPAGASIDASTGAFAWTPTEAQGPGSYTFRVVVSDGTLTDEEEITVTVGEVNLAPVLASVGNQAVNEGATLSFTASAADADLPVNGLAYSLAGTVPAGATINASTGAFTWTPAETQGPGSYTFRVVVSDGALTDEEEITVTINEVNLAPVLAAVGSKTVNEGATLSFTASAADADLPANALAYSLVAPASGTYPTGATITAAGGFSWTPTETQGPGVYRVKVVVSDGALSDEEEIEITVNEVNEAPVLAAIGSKTMDEGTALAFTASATDTDLPANALTYALAGTVPAGAAIDASTGEFAWTPTETQGPGSYNFRVVVSDGALTDEEEITVTVGEVNEAPVLAAVGSKTVNEGATLSFTAVAADNDLPANALAYSLAAPASGTYPTGAVITSAGAFSWTPTETQGPGVYRVKIVVTDGALTDEEEIEITVNEVNEAPVLAAIGSKTVDELTTLAFTASATDTDLPANALTYSLAGTVPTGASIDAATGAFTWTPTETQGPGSYTFRVVVSDGALTDEEEITVTVNEVNLAPVLASLGNQAVNEGATLSFTAAAADADLPANALAYSLAAPATGTYPTGAVIATAGEFSWTPTETQGPGVYRVKVVVSDGTLTDEEEIEITVNEVNEAPVLAAIGSKTVNEGATLSFTAAATDVDLPASGLQYSLGGAIPAGASIDAATGAFTWTPTETQGPHAYTFTVVASDGTLSDEEEITVTVGEVNEAPVLASVGSKTVNEGATLSFTASATDADLPANAPVFIPLAAPSQLPNALTFGLSGTVPAGAAIDAATGEFTWTPTEAQGPGSYTFTVVVSDGELTDEEEITVTVGEVNLAPVLAAIGSKTVDEGTTLAFTASATDADLPANVLAYSLAGTVPAGASIDAATGAFTWTPTETQGPGSYTFRVVVSDGALTDEEEITVTVNEVNVAPVLAAVGGKTVNEGTELAFTVAAADADLPANALAYSLSAPAAGVFPAGAAVDATTGAFTWTPTETQGPGVYRVKVVVSDGTLTDEEEIEITVGEVNEAPVLAAIGSKTVDELTALVFTASATDADLPANALTYSLAGTVPTGASIDASTGAFTWTPAEAQGPGSYTFRVVVSDGALTDEEEITVTVNEVNLAPVLASVGNQTVAEETTLSFTASATDVDLPANPLAYSLAGTVPAGASIDASTGAFTWTPAEAQGPGSYTFRVVVSDGALTDEEEITVTVGEVNLAPVLALIGGKTADELTELAFTASSTDADLPANALAYSLAAPATGTYPTGAAITAAGGFSWTPTETQGPGVYRVKVVVSDGTLTDEEEIEITVREVNTAPAFTSQPVLSVVEDTPYSYTATAADGDSPANALTLAATGLPAWMTFNPATGVLSGTPENAQVGVYPVVLTVTDGMLTVEQTFALEVRNQNDAPVITAGSAVANVTVAEDQPLSVPFEVSDVDSPLSALRVRATSGNAALVPVSAISFAGTGSTRTVQFTPLPDTFGGPLTLTLEVSDGELTASTSFQVTVLPVNDAPTVNPVAEVELRINSPAQTLTLTGISAGPANENDQQLALSVQSDNPVMIPAADIVYHGNGTATLHFTPARSQTLTDPATLTVTIRDNGGRERGGEDTRQLRIPVRFLPTNNAVFMPNLFTPNGDLSNDRFTVLGEGIERITFRIFDKKGTMVYESKDVQEATTRGWDGTYRGETLPAGVYTWQIVGTFLDGSPLHYQGKKAGSVLLSR
jgi:gliding motility-associated-like protein